MRCQPCASATFQVVVLFGEKQKNGEGLYLGYAELEGSLLWPGDVSETGAGGVWRRSWPSLSTDTQACGVECDPGSDGALLGLLLSPVAYQPLQTAWRKLRGKESFPREWMTVFSNSFYEVLHWEVSLRGGPAGV